MSRLVSGPIVATELNKNNKFTQVPISGKWDLAYGKDHAIGYFIDFEPLDEIAEAQCNCVNLGEDDGCWEGEREYDPISLDQMFDGISVRDWCEILATFGIEQRL